MIKGCQFMVVRLQKVSLEFEIYYIYQFLGFSGNFINNIQMEVNKVKIFKNYEFMTVKGIACQLGFGAYGSVQLAKCLKTGETVAIKKTSTKIASGQVEVHMKLNHPNIIKLLDYEIDEKNDCTYLILQYAENGTLFDFIRSNCKKDRRIINGIFYSVCDAIEYLHSKNIMHRDIKPQNILFDRKNVAKVCDFGFAVSLEPRKTLCGTLEYMSPQMLLKKPYNHKIDIWALGILLYELIQGKAPYSGFSIQQMLNQMKTPIKYTYKFTSQQIQLIQLLLKFNPSHRPEIKDISKNPCLSSSFDELQNLSKRSTTDQQMIAVSPKIKIMEIKQIEPVSKKSKSKIQITSIRNLTEGSTTPSGQSNDRLQKFKISLMLQNKQKISLKKYRKP